MKVILAVMCTSLRGSLSFMSLSAVQIYDFHIFLTVKSLLVADFHDLITKS